MDKRNYNPLNEGYTGKKKINTLGYSGNQTNSSGAPRTIPNLQSGIIKPEPTTTPNNTRNR
ncbi:MAG: hypothetical protein HQK84_01705 [Nitrospinae bacterium]|nr:hypothetical protein [Nitrospinota bacterium]